MFIKTRLGKGEIFIFNWDDGVMVCVIFYCMILFTDLKQTFKIQKENLFLCVCVGAFGSIKRFVCLCFVGCCLLVDLNFILFVFIRTSAHIRQRSAAFCLLSHLMFGNINVTNDAPSGVHLFFKSP